MFGFSTAKLIGLAVAAAAILSFVLMAFHWKEQAADRAEKLALICQTTRDAAVNPKLACKDVPVQITLLGKAVTNLKAGIASQNFAINRMADATKAAQDAAATAQKRASQRVERVEATSTRLSASSRSSVSQAKPCAPSKALTETWR